METLSVVISFLALIVSFVSLWRVREIKELDLRLELNKVFNNLDIALSGIDAYLDFVHQSHERVLAATGMLNSGAQKIFEDEFTKDKAKLQELLSNQPIRKDTYKGSPQLELEKEIVAVHAYHNQIADLRAKYNKIFDSDEERRKEIRARHQ